MRTVHSYAVLPLATSQVFRAPHKLLVVRNFLSSLNAPSTLLPYLREVLCEATERDFTPGRARLCRGCKEIFKGKELQHETVEVP